MTGEGFRLSYPDCRRILRERLEEPAPGRIQLLTGPRQVGKTTLLLELSQGLGKEALYAAADEPGAAAPGYWERLFTRAEDVARAEGRAVVLLDEAHLLPDWAALLKGVTDRFRRLRLPIHVVATGSSALRLAIGSKETLAGRFERLTLTHWPAASLVNEFGISAEAAVDLLVRMGSYPGAFGLRDDWARWSAYIRDAILEPAIGRDILALARVRRPALLRQVFGVAASSPAQIVSLQKMQGQLQDSGALETIAHYLELLEEGYLVAPIAKYSSRTARSRSSPPKLITLSNAFLAVMHSRGTEGLGSDPARFGSWVENACLAHAWNAGQQLWYWREEPLEIDAVTEGSWGAWAIEVKIGELHSGALTALLEFVRRNRRFQPLVLCNAAGRPIAERAGVKAITWQEFLLAGPPGIA
jgi:predicted AAA+ superfamily ATPase